MAARSCGLHESNHFAIKKLVGTVSYRAVDAIATGHKIKMREAEVRS